MLRHKGVSAHARKTENPGHQWVRVEGAGGGGGTTGSCEERRGASAAGGKGIVRARMETGAWISIERPFVNRNKIQVPKIINHHVTQPPTSRGANAPVVERHPHVRIVHGRREREKVDEGAAKAGERGVLDAVVEHHAHARVRQRDQQLQHQHRKERAHRVERGKGAVPNLAEALALKTSWLLFRRR